MPYPRRFSAKMPDFDDDVTVVDVYDLASDIGKECEIIIEKYGSEAVTALLPKVINALELLENLAVRNEKENQALQELTAKISQLENDKIEKAEYRQRFEKEIEAIEEQWRTESAELVTAVARLQDENKRLRRTINAPSDGTSAPPSPAREHDQEVLSRLSSTAEKQRATLRHQEVQLQEKQQLIESLTNQVEKLAQVSRDLRRKHKQMQNHMRLICEERSELTAIVQNQQRDINALQQANAQNTKCAACGAGTPDGMDDEEHSNRPTFSVREIRAILHERNELKLRLSKAEEQLQALQQEPQPDSSGSDTSPSLSSTQTAEEDEAPVQGPLPAEPDDAPWKRNSGIRKLWLKYWEFVTRAERDLFASSLLSLISPWARSRAARCPRWQARWPPPDPPRPPPLPRRHSIPPSHSHTEPKDKHRRYSDIKKPSKLDLRQELLNLNLNKQEVSSWLGHVEEMDENHHRFEFEHDIPLQRSISLDRGLHIINYLQTVGSDWSGSSVASSWTVHSDRDRFAEHCRSFEDIPASPFAKSRRASTDVDYTLGRSLGLTVLKDSYKGIDVGSGSISPQIKKLQRNFSFKNSFEDFKSVPGSSEDLNASDSGTRRVPILVRSVSLETRAREQEGKTVRQRKFGMQMNIDHHRDIRREVLKQNCFNFKSCENLSTRNVSKSRRGSADCKENSLGLTLLRDSYKGEFSTDIASPSILKLKRSFLFRSSSEISRNVPTIVVSDCHGPRGSFAKNKYSNTSLEVDTSSLSVAHSEVNTMRKHTIFAVDSESVEDTFESALNSFESTANSFETAVDTSESAVEFFDTIENTSNSVDLSRTCDCRICREDDGEDKPSFLSRNLTKIFTKIVSGRNLMCWDENNNMSEGEMYSCVMQVLKLLFGLWLRHLDHN